MAATEKLETIFDLRVIAFIAALSTVLSVESRSLPASSKIDPDVFRNVSQLIENRGYPVEEHSVVTQDGFILSVQRIPQGRKEGPWDRIGGPKPVVFLQHGLLGDASNWVQNWAWNSLGYILADNGMDVWLGNVRGNRYSRHRVKLKPTQSGFWDWSFQEMAEYDIPAMLGYALNVSGQPQLFYIGHSQGTLVGFIGFSSNPELAKKVKLFIALAPIFSLNHTAQSVRDLAFVLYPIQTLFHLSGDIEFLSGRVIDFLIEIGFCNEKWSEKACYDIIEAVFGNDDSNFNMSRAPVFLSNWPAGTSLKNIIHFAQIIVYGKCQMFDYGKAGNWKHYHQDSPPVYNVTRMTTPTALFCGKMDTLSDETDNKALKGKIRNLKYFEEIPNWNHMDFIIGFDATRVLYETIVDMIKGSVMSEMYN